MFPNQKRSLPDGGSAFVVRTKRGVPAKRVRPEGRGEPSSAAAASAAVAAAAIAIAAAATAAAAPAAAAAAAEENDDQNDDPKAAAAPTVIIATTHTYLPPTRSWKPVFPASFSSYAGEGKWCGSSSGQSREEVTAAVACWAAAWVVTPEATSRSSRVALWFFRGKFRA